MAKMTALTMKSSRMAARSRRIMYVSTMWRPDAVANSGWLPAATVTPSPTFRWMGLDRWAGGRARGVTAWRRPSTA